MTFPANFKGVFMSPDLPRGSILHFIAQWHDHIDMHLNEVQKTVNFFGGQKLGFFLCKFPIVYL